MEGARSVYQKPQDLISETVSETNWSEAMKFLVEKVGPAHSRLGYLTEFLPDISGCQTPLCLLYTKAGSVPHLTHEVLQYLIGKTMLPMLFPLPSTTIMKDAVAAHGKGLAKFVGLGEFPAFISMQDPAVATPSNYNDKVGVSIWKHTGREHLDVATFMKIQETFLPCWYQALCDSDTPQNCSKKRMSHSVQRSLSFLDKCLELHLTSSKLRDTAIFGTVEGGYDAKAREFSARETALRPVDGFVIDGFHQNGPDTENVNMLEVKPLLQSVVSHLPNSKPRVLFGPFKPTIVVDAVLCGIDVFDTSYAYITTERGKALAFPLQYKASISHSSEAKFAMAELDISDRKHRDDFSPLLQNCSCYTCRKFTRAYIHHLLTSSELLASVLLMIHNLYHYMNFLSVIRQAIDDDKLKEFKALLDNVYH